MNEIFVAQGYKAGDFPCCDPPEALKPSGLALEVIQELRALCDRVEAGELTFRVITFEVLPRGQRVTLETDK